MNVYRRILGTPHVAALIGAALLTRLPFGVNGLAILLFLRAETGSFGIAGLVTGALALGTALGGPFASRLVDRRGAAFLVPLAFVQSASVISIWPLGVAGAPTAVLALAALIAGATSPPAGQVLRSRYPELLRDERLIHGAYAFDSVTIELAFVTGPLLVAIIVALVGPQYAFAVSSALSVLGTILFVARMPVGSRAPHPAAAQRGALGALADRGIVLIALTTIPIGFCLGSVEVSLPAFADAEGDHALAGILLAIWSGASALGGLIYGARAGGPRLDTFLRIGVVFPFACLPMVVATSPAMMVPLAILAGLPIAPLIASRNLLVGALAPGGTGAESFTWLMTALVVGASAGTAIGGALIEASGWETAVLAGSAIAALGGAAAFSLRGSIRPRLATS